MTWPRRIVPGTTYLLTRRCTQRRFMLVPRGIVPKQRSNPGTNSEPIERTLNRVGPGLTPGLGDGGRGRDYKGL